MLSEKAMTQVRLISRSTGAGYIYAVVQRNSSPTLRLGTHLMQFRAFLSESYNGRSQVTVLQSLHYLRGVHRDAH